MIDLIRPQHVVCIGTAAELPQAHLSRTPASSEELVWAVTRLDELAWVTSYRLFYRVHAADRWIALGHFDGNRDAATVNLAHLSKPRPGGGGGAASKLRAAYAHGGVLARFFKLVPTAWHNRPRLRVAVYGPQSPFISESHITAANAVAGLGTVRYVLRRPTPGPTGPVSGDLADGPRAWCTKCGRTCSCALPVAEAGKRCSCRHLCRDHRPVPDESSIEAAPQPRSGRCLRDGCSRGRWADGRARVLPAGRRRAGRGPAKYAGSDMAGWKCLGALQEEALQEEEEEEEEGKDEDKNNKNSQDGWYRMEEERGQLSPAFAARSDSSWSLCSSDGTGSWQEAADSEGCPGCPCWSECSDCMDESCSRCASAPLQRHCTPSSSPPSPPPLILTPPVPRTVCGSHGPASA